MGKGLWPQRRIAHRSRIQAHQHVRPNLTVIKCGQLHEEIVRMLTIYDWFAERCFSLLKKFWIKSSGDRCRFKAEHGAQRQLTRAIASLSHRHHPVHREELVVAPRPGLL